MGACDKEWNSRTIQRVAQPTGIFYAQGGPSRAGIRPTFSSSIANPPPNARAGAHFHPRATDSHSLGRQKPWTEKLWIYDLRTNKHFTLKESPLKRSDLDDFVACYNPKNRHERKESERFKSFAYEDLLKRDP